MNYRSFFMLYVVLEYEDNLKVALFVVVNNSCFVAKLTTWLVVSSSGCQI